MTFYPIYHIGSETYLSPEDGCYDIHESVLAKGYRKVHS